MVNLNNTPQQNMNVDMTSVIPTSKTTTSKFYKRRNVVNQDIVKNPIEETPDNGSKPIELIMLEKA